ncbi:MAG: hypothetical protein ACJAS9_000292 [Polaribacter sp.]|jgi:hypothetical protein
MHIKAKTETINIHLVIFGITILFWNIGAMITNKAVSLWALVIWYLFAWTWVNYFLRNKLSKIVLDLKERVAVILIILGMVFFGFYEHGSRFIKFESLKTIQTRSPDRLRLENLPSIAPAIVVAGRPQTFHIYAPNQSEIKWQFKGGDKLPTQYLGEGLFRLDYNPRHNGSSSANVSLSMGGVIVERQLKHFAPLSHPRGLVSNPENGLAFTVSEETDELIIIDRNGGVKVFRVGDGPSDIAIVNNSVVAISHRFEPNLWLFDHRKNQIVGKIRVGVGQHHLAKHPTLSELAVTVKGSRSLVVVIDVNQEKIKQQIEVSDSPEWIVYGPKGETLVFSGRTDRGLFRLDKVNSRFVIKVKPLLFGRPIITLSNQSGASNVYVATTGYEPSGKSPMGNHFVQDQLLNVAIDDWEVVEQMLTTRRTQQQNDPVELRSGGSPMGITQTLDNEVLVTFAGTDEVWKFQDNKLPSVILNRNSIGRLWAPHGIADLGEGRFAVTSPSQGAVGVFDRENGIVAITHLALDDHALEKINPTALKIRKGERSFYETTRAGLSCQSCHTDNGESDRSAHNITSRSYKGEIILYTTLSLKGIAKTAPYLRDASFDSIADLMIVARSRYKGYIRHSANRGRNLQLWVESLPLQLNPQAIEGRNIKKEQAGLKAYKLAECNLCHSFPAFTNLGQHLPSRLFPDYAKRRNSEELFDTPSLLALSTSPPYLQDGRANTIESIFDPHNKYNRHGNTEILSKQERADLIFFLKAL